MSLGIQMIRMTKFYQFFFVGLFVATRLTTAIYPKAKLIQSLIDQKIYIPGFAISSSYGKILHLANPSRGKYYI